MGGGWYEGEKGVGWGGRGGGGGPLLVEMMLAKCIRDVEERFEDGKG